MKTEIDVSRIFVQFIASGVRHARIDSYRKCRAARYSGIHSSHYFGLKQLCFAGLM